MRLELLAANGRLTIVDMAHRPGRRIVQKAHLDALKVVRQAQAVHRAFGNKALIARVGRVLGMEVFGAEFYQRPIINLIRQEAGTHQTYIDVGAADGTIAVAVAGSFHSCLAIEPYDGNLRMLQDALRARRIGNCRVLSCALSARTGTAKLHLSPTNPDDNSLAERPDLGATVDVPTTTLDLVVRETRVEEPFLIKIDVQGCELEVLKGAEQTLSRKSTIVSEFWPWGLLSAGSSPMEYVAFMKAQSYEPYDLAGRLVTEESLSRICRLGADNCYVTTDFVFKKA